MITPFFNRFLDNHIRQPAFSHAGPVTSDGGYDDDNSASGNAGPIASDGFYEYPAPTEDGFDPHKYGDVEEDIIATKETNLGRVNVTSHGYRWYQSANHTIYYEGASNLRPVAFDSNDDPLPKQPPPLWGGGVWKYDDYDEEWAFHKSPEDVS